MSWPSLGVPELRILASQRRDGIVRSCLITRNYHSKTVAGLQRKSDEKRRNFSEAQLMVKEAGAESETDYRSFISFDPRQLLSLEQKIVCNPIGQASDFRADFLPLLVRSADRTGGRANLDVSLSLWLGAAGAQGDSATLAQAKDQHVARGGIGRPFDRSQSRFL